jgi:hypothetical protein
MLAVSNREMDSGAGIEFCARPKLLLTSFPDWHIVPLLNEKLAAGPDEPHFSFGGACRVSYFKILLLPHKA